MENEIKLNRNEKKKKYEDYEIEGALNTLIRAEEIKQDKELMKLIAPKIDKQLNATNNVAEILYGKKEKTNES